MTRSPSILLLVGSVRRPSSNSEMLLSYLKDRLTEYGCDTELLHIERALQSDEEFQILLKKIRQSDALILASPVYMYAFPAQVVEFFERFAETAGSEGTQKNIAFGVILNCGLPEAHHNDIAAAIAQAFAGEVRFQWLGALTLGGGEIINTRPISRNSGLLRHIIRALDMAAYALKDLKPFPDEAIRIIRKGPLPRWIYNTSTNKHWKKASRNFNPENQLNDQPFRKKDP